MFDQTSDVGRLLDRTSDVGCLLDQTSDVKSFKSLVLFHGLCVGILEGVTLEHGHSHAGHVFARMLPLALMFGELLLLSICKTGPLLDEVAVHLGFISCVNI